MSSSLCWTENDLADAKFDFHHRIDVTPDVDRARRRRELALAQDDDPGGPGAVREQPLRRPALFGRLGLGIAPCTSLTMAGDVDNRPPLLPHLLPFKIFV